MILAGHLILTAYGFWLPNDLRGSWSDFVGSWELLRFGPATKVDTRRSVAHQPHNRRARLAAKRHLKYRPVRFSGAQARAVGRGFAAFVERNGLVVWACSILPEHVHLVVARHRYHFDRVIELMKSAATRRLTEEGLHPFRDITRPDGQHPKPFARGGWSVFLDTDAAVRRAIRYAEDNPAREGLPRQQWSFVRPYEGV